jgi:hypothetical protein
MDVENNTPEDTFQSDYDAEWGLESDSPPKVAPSDTEANQKSTDEETAPNPVAQEGTQEAPKDEDPNKAAEPQKEDIFAGMTEAQIEAYRKSERDTKAMKGRHKLAQDRIADLEKKLSSEKKANGELIEKARQPSEFEQNHPEYYKELKAELGTKQDADDDPQVDPDGESYSEADSILSAHPDAGDVYNSPEFKTWISQQPLQFQQNINSSYAKDVIPILDAYSASLEANTQESLKDISSVGGSQSKPSLRNHGNMSDEEKYDLEWETDD